MPISTYADRKNEGFDCAPYPWGCTGPDPKVSAAEMDEPFRCAVKPGIQQKAEGDTWVGEGGDDRLGVFKYCY